MTVIAAQAQAGQRKWWALAALTVGLLAVGMDATLLSVALPTLARSLHASMSDLQWFVSAYALALAVALLPGGLLGDRYGRKRVMLAALAVFGMGSAACAYAPSPGAFIAARALLGLSAGAMVPLSLSVLTVTFSDAERPKAVGAWAGANFLALPIGPILGGWLLSHYWWGWVFLMNLPVVVVGMIAVAWLLPESRAQARPGLDAPGVLASCAGLALLVYGFIAAGQHGWACIPALTALSAGVALLAAFAAWDLRLGRRPGGQPLVDMGLFRSARFTSGTILSGVGIFAMFGLLFATPQYFQAVLGVNAMGSGLRLLPMLAGLAAGAVMADRVAALIGAKMTVAGGFAVLAAGLAAGATMTVATSGALIAAWTAVSGLGFGLALATAASAALAGLPPDRAGIGSAVMQAVQKVGAPLSVAILGSVLTSGYQSRLEMARLPAAAAPARSGVFTGIALAHKLASPRLLATVRAAFVHGTDSLLLASAALAVAGIVLALAFLPWRATEAGAPADLLPGGSALPPAGGESPHERPA